MRMLLRYLFFLFFVRPLVLIIIGLNIRHKEHLPQKGPAIIVANHNSHLDTLVLITILPKKVFNIVHPIAAMDYFCKSKFLNWFSRTIMQIIPLERKFGSYHTDPLEGIVNALENNKIVIIYPEGSRGEPEQMSRFKNGIYHLAQRKPDVPIIPVFIHGLGKVLPRGEGLIVPFFCDVFIGKVVPFDNDRIIFMENLVNAIKSLSTEEYIVAWE